MNTKPNRTRRRTLLLRLMTSCDAAWTFFQGSPNSGEIHVGGFAFSTRLDCHGCPEIDDNIYAALLREADRVDRERSMSTGAS